MSKKKDFDRDSISNTLMVAVGLSLVCSVIVSSAAIVLKPIQEKNEEEFRQQIILDVAGLMQPDGIHPNARGHAIVAEKVTPFVERLVRETARR